MVRHMRLYSGTAAGFRKSLVVFAFLMAVWGPARGQALTANTVASSTVSAKPAKVSESPLFFPRDWVRGYVDFAVAPPHNEPDLGRCTGAGPDCGAFARYILSGYIEIQPIGRGPLRHLFGYLEPRFFMGNNVPQVNYTASADPLALEQVLGLGFELPRGFEMRLETHRVSSFGKYAHSLGPTDPGPGQPLGLYSTVGVRWNFGGYGRRSHSW
jgi:hypothetical protein